MKLLGGENADLMFQAREDNHEIVNLRKELDESKRLFESMKYEKT